MKNLRRIAGLISILGIITAQDGPESVQPGAKQFQENVLVSGLADPWELTWGPGNRFSVTRRIGNRITRIHPATGDRNVAITIGEVSAPGGSQRNVSASYDRAGKTSPPGTHADLIAYILQGNGFKTGEANLRPDAGKLKKMVLK